MDTIAGKYEVIQELGKGGYGAVFLVRHRDLGVNYALKLLSRALSEDVKTIERFKREAEVLLRFAHPGSAQLRDFGKTEDGLYYIAMDYCVGKSLRAILDERERITYEETLTIIMDILEVLAAAHEVGVIHRDIKPDNIIIQGDNLTKSGCVKILDFGVAKLKEQSLTTTRTMEGASLGTPQYMAPEQAAGDSDIDHRVDIYATGILAYELLTGFPPFIGESVVQTLLMHITRPPPKIAEEYLVPPEVEALLLIALEKDREDRYPSCREFLTATRKISQALKGGQEIVFVSEKRAEAPKQSVSSPVNSDTPKTKILCLDDSEMILNILKHLLEKEGYEVFTATDPSSIYSSLFAEKVSLLISDVQMPGLSGTKVCQMLKKSLSDLKIVLFSNIPERELEKLSKESRADDWISKNASPNDWLAKVREVIERTAVQK